LERKKLEEENMEKARLKEKTTMKKKRNFYVVCISLFFR
jgi:hypothetical protein